MVANTVRCSAMIIITVPQIAVTHQLVVPLPQFHVMIMMSVLVTVVYLPKVAKTLLLFVMIKISVLQIVVSLLLVVNILESLMMIMMPVPLILVAQLMVFNMNT
jgi:hypothetical protein